MTRFISLGLLGLLAASPARAAEDLAGVWRQETEGIGVSFWELTPRGEHTYAAQEYGIGSVKGTARLEGGRLVIRFDDPDRGRYEWRLRGTAGKGVFISGEGKVYENSSVRFIGK
jgi:hypothetical protein